MIVLKWRVLLVSCLLLWIQGVKEVEDTWNNIKFEVLQYNKGGSLRGYVLGPMDEITQCLDDTSMNLQSMSASRYIGPFAGLVQIWEKSLAHISEVLDVGSQQLFI